MTGISSAFAARRLSSRRGGTKMPKAVMTVVALLAALTWASMASAQNKVPSERALDALVKVSLLSFNDANVTGNYTVFHAKLSKPFRDQFPPEKLAATFKEFRDKRIDFDLIAAKKPISTEEPKINNGTLSIKGYFDTSPARLNYDLGFIVSEGE